MSKKYFINNIDTLIGENLLKEICKEEGGEYNIMGTYMDRTKIAKPKGIKKILKVTIFFNNNKYK